MSEPTIMPPMDSDRSCPSSIPESRRDKTGDWPEDLAHENGNYRNRCGGCGITFQGHKRRVRCKICMEPTITPATCEETGHEWKPDETIGYYKLSKCARCGLVGSVRDDRAMTEPITPATDTEIALLVDDLGQPYFQPGSMRNVTGDLVLSLLARIEADRAENAELEAAHDVVRMLCEKAGVHHPERIMTQRNKACAENAAHKAKLEVADAIIEDSDATRTIRDLRAMNADLTREIQRHAASIFGQENATLKARVKALEDLIVRWIQEPQYRVLALNALRAEGNAILARKEPPDA